MQLVLYDGPSGTLKTVVTCRIGQLMMSGHAVQPLQLAPGSCELVPAALLRQNSTGIRSGRGSLGLLPPILERRRSTYELRLPRAPHKCHEERTRARTKSPRAPVGIEPTASDPRRTVLYL